MYIEAAALKNICIRFSIHQAVCDYRRTLRRFSLIAESYPSEGKALKKTQKKKKRQSSVIPLYLATAVWAIMTLVMPMHKLAAIIATAVISGAVGFAVGRILAKKAPAPEPEPEAEPEVEESPYDAEVQAIIDEGMLAQKEMGRLYASIDDKEIRTKINQLMQVSDKIVQDAKHDPADVPQIKKFLSYYLPTTIKLLNAYDRMDAQGIEGSNITGTMNNIKDMLDTAIVAYRKQLDSLFANQALDIDTDISVMNAMLAREGLLDDFSSPRPQSSPAGAADSAGAVTTPSPAVKPSTPVTPNTGYESPFGDASPLSGSSAAAFDSSDISDITDFSEISEITDIAANTDNSDI